MIDSPELAPEAVNKRALPELNNFPLKLNHTSGEDTNPFNPRLMWEMIGQIDTPFKEIQRDPELRTGYSNKYLSQTPRQFYEIIDKVQASLGINPEKLGEMRRRLDKASRERIDEHMSGTDSLERKTTTNSLYEEYIQECIPVYDRLLELGYNEQDLQRG